LQLLHPKLLKFIKMKTLSRNEMKNVMGGNAPYVCYFQNADLSVGAYGGANSGANAQAAATANGTHWCCSSCATASWMQGLY
jgi:hypothetical protein